MSGNKAHKNANVEAIAQLLWEASDEYDEEPVLWEDNYARREWYDMATAVVAAGFSRNAAQ